MRGHCYTVPITRNQLATIGDMDVFRKVLEIEGVSEI